MIAARISACASAMAAVLIALPAEAAVGRWTSGYGQGISSATVGNGRATFIVSCPAGSPVASPGFMIELPGMRRQGMDQAVQTQIRVDGHGGAFTFTRDRAGNVSWDANSPGGRRDMQQMLQRMRRGEAFTVSIPALNVRERFTLRGARRELAGCLRAS